MDKNNSYFVISGLLSFSLFLLFLSLFVYMMFVQEESKVYGVTKDKFIAVSVVIPKKTVKVKSQTKMALSSHSNKSESLSENIDVNDLFSDVWTPKIKHVVTKRKVNSKRIQDIAKKIKKAETNRVDSLSKKIEKLETTQGNKNEEVSSSANEVNEYLAKIQAIVYQHFHVPPNSEGNSVKTVIELDPLGHVTDFRVLEYSSNKALNEEVDKIKKRLRNVVFPKNPKNSSSRTIVVLISKE